MDIEITDDLVVHRVGGGAMENLQLLPGERLLNPVGFSILVGGTPQEASETILRAFDTRKWRRLAERVASATIRDIRSAGFDVIADESRGLPNHGRLIHAAGEIGFDDANLLRLIAVWIETETP